MPAQRLKATGHRRERSRSRSPWVRDPEPFSTNAAHASTISNDNNNQNVAYGPANIVNSNQNFNLQSSSVYYNQVTNIATSTPIHTPDISDAMYAMIAAALKERFVPQAVYDAQLNSGCMENTRVRILNEIEVWIQDPDALQICWITGMAGTGKTSISKTVCKRANANPNITLGGSFFCSRSTGLAAQRDIRCVIPTLSQLLALQSAEFRLALAEIIEPGIQYKEASVQVEQLLYTPLSALKDSQKPILFVIDALDECGGETSDGMLDDANCHAVVASMLEALVSLTQSNSRLDVKFLVTSRPETQIRDTPISNEKLSRILRLHTVDIAEVDMDIRRYIIQTLDAKLSSKPKLRAGISTDEIEDLVRLCDGLFIVAATALKHTMGAGADAAVAKFKRLLNASRDNLSLPAATPLDNMYALILHEAASVDGSEDADLPALLRLLAALLAARMKLSIEALSDLLGVETYDVRASLSRLHSVVHVPEDDDVPGLRTVHASFGDYLHGRAPSHIGFTRTFGQAVLAHGCLDVMVRLLHFNISRSISSYQPNPSTRPNEITLALEYACLHWAHHVVACEPCSDTASDTHTFNLEINQKFRPKLLFWLEVLSVLGKIILAPGLLSIARAAVRDNGGLQFLEDAIVFLASSHEAVERSAPHIYLSALPFADRKSLIYQQFFPQFNGLITVDRFGVAQHGEGASIMRLIGHSGAVYSASYSSDGRLLASGSADGTVRIWNAQTGEEAMSPLRSGDGSVLSVDFAQNDKQIASGTEGGVLCVWNIAQGQAYRRLSGHSGPVYSVAFSPDCTRLASASGDIACLWNAETGEQLVVLTGHRHSVDGVAFSHNGNILASSSGNRIIRFWNSSTGQPARNPLHARLRHSSAQDRSESHGVDFSPDGEMIAVIIAYHQDSVAFWSLENGKRLAQLQGTTKIRSARFSSDGRSLVAAHGRDVRLWTLHPDPANAPYVDLGGHTDDVSWATFSPDNRYIASASDDGTIRIWNAGSGQSAVQLLLTHTEDVNSVAVSRDGRFIVSGSNDKSVRVWNACTGEETFPPLLGHTGGVESVAISPDGCLIASASQDKTVRLWDARSGAAIGGSIGGHTAVVRAVTFSNDGCWLASASDNWTVHLWDPVTRKPSSVGPMRCDSWVFAIAFSPDDKLVAAGDYGGRIYLWRTDTGEKAREPFQADHGFVLSLAFSPDGTRIASSGSEQVVRIWDVSTRQMILELQGHTSYISSVAWSADGRLIGTGSHDRTVRLWDALTGAPLATLHGHTEEVRSVTFTSDGQYIVSGSRDCMIRKWDVPAACRLASESSNNPVTALASARLENGWLVGSSGEILLWVPAEYREHLQLPPCALWFKKSRVVITAPDNGLHVGSKWTSCWRA